MIKIMQSLILDRETTLGYSLLLLVQPCQLRHFFFVRNDRNLFLNDIQWTGHHPEAAEKLMLDGEHLDLALILIHLGFSSFTDLDIGCVPFCFRKFHVLCNLWIHRVAAGVWDIDFYLCPFDFFFKKKNWSLFNNFVWPWDTVISLGFFCLFVCLFNLKPQLWKVGNIS